MHDLQFLQQPRAVKVIRMIVAPSISFPVDRPVGVEPSKARSATLGTRIAVELRPPLTNVDKTLWLWPRRREPRKTP
jgi:hypothetical protein